MDYTLRCFAESAERILQLALNSFSGEVADDGLFGLAGAITTELGGENPVVTAAFDGFADHALGQVVGAVAGSGVDEVEAQLMSAVKDALNFFGGELFAPVAAILPGAKTDSGNFQVGFA